MKTNKHFLCIDSYVHINIKKESALIYNTFNGSIITTKKPIVVNLLRRLKNNLFVIPLTQSEIDNSELRKFISKLKKNFSGFVFFDNLSKAKPIQIYPKLILGDNMYSLNIDNKINYELIYLNCKRCC